MASIDDVRRAIAKVPGVRLALLFGSRARGTERDDSDVDVALDGPNVDRLSAAAALGAALGLRVDVVDLRDATIPLLEELLRDAVVVHEASPGAGASWRSRILTQLETDRPWYARMRDAWLARVAEEGL
jgi:predicted nucleotidyltransferase